MILKKRNSLKYKLLLLTGLFLDEALEWIRVVSSREKLYLYDRGYQIRNIQNFLREITKTGFIEKKVENGKPVFRLTSQGKIKISRSLPLIKMSQQKWDGLFRAAAFDIPEKKRNLRSLIRERLKNLGFGMMQESLWITPYSLTEPLSEFIFFHHLENYVLIMESRYLSVESARDLVWRVWHLEKVQENYLEFWQKWQEKIVNKKELIKLAGQWRGEYFDLLENDPYLPQELLPDNWVGFRARKLFFTLENLVK